ncbi:MAG: signal peptidase I [Synechococcus sp. SB0668_bin_15]|nr:signal peptidase I [Synechococcus sp. SB0668_bin_15]MXZ82543.1 signal peptidase I [Synechococcus sp. SB0666_bin_14]MYC50239.1 signal peptidase I [Synechococcus sp. SB0662_bin_14]MYG46723.1 signal peptidase I [Synechococcus sp. SB0675_bin_6]MYJ59887.1 signal peptidase I [Synechococcus sp. SB0672_bin_6]MYK91911.1 signal peptidase I [Synechococcus sp. SB0669_bin_8]
MDHASPTQHLPQLQGPEEVDGSLIHTVILLVALPASRPDSDHIPVESPWRHGWRTLLSLVLVVALTMAVRQWIMEPRWIPSGSMAPTLQVRDLLVVDKLSPRLGCDPRVGDVVMFQPPDALLAMGYDRSQMLIKRVVGLAGDRIAVHEGQLERNGQALREPWTATPMAYEQPEVTVPPHRLWVLGDNRNNSLDSHVWGSLPQDRVAGRALIRYWPPQRWGGIPGTPRIGCGDHHS